MNEVVTNSDKEKNTAVRIKELERENRKMRREITHLKNAIMQEKLASTTILNQQKASTFIQRERERYLALLLTNSPSIILFLNNMGRIEFCTDYFIKKGGFDNRTKVQGQLWADILARFLDDETMSSLQEHSSRVNRTNESSVFESRFYFGGDNTEEIFAGLIVPMNDDTNNSNGIMLMFQDITELKRSQEEALEASKAKSSFLSNMSHEIRTPLNAIVGMTLIGKQEKELSKKDQAFAKIEDASALLLGIINDILDISKIESGKMELSDVTFDFKKMLNKVRNVITLKMKEKDQQFSAVIDSEIPEFLYGDDQHLTQVITNIMSNATKFTSNGGIIKFQVELLSRTEDRCRLQFSVRDSGIGMTREQQGKLFNIFQQAEAGTSRKYGGSGLGLAISKRILELMGGEIWVESEQGEGSCFYFTADFCIPDSAQVREEHQDMVKTLDYSAETDIDFSGKTLLLADDVDINLEIICVLLEPTHITIDTARDGRETVALFEKNPHRYDVIFMDVQMPEVDGLEATRQIRSLPVPQAAEIPIIAMTANVFKEDIKRCLAAGMNAHIGKPIDMDDIMAKLAYYLRG